MGFFKKMAQRLTPPRVDISLKLGKSTYYLGDKLEGELSISSSEDFEASEIRIELECVEAAKAVKYVYDQARKREVPVEVWESARLYFAKIPLAGKLHISEGFRGDYAFSAEIPITLKPTYKGIDRRVTWTIKGVVAVEGRPDATSRAIEIQVAQPQAPAVKEREVIKEVVMAPCKYCGALFPITEKFCPRCGAPRTS